MASTEENRRYARTGSLTSLISSNFGAICLSPGACSTEICLYRVDAAGTLGPALPGGGGGGGGGIADVR